MQYYNTLVKIYNPEKSKSLRFIRFNDLKYRATNQKDKDNLKLFHSRRIVNEIENAEVLKDTEKRDYKQETISRAKRVVKEIIRNNFSDRLKFLTLTYSYEVDRREKVMNDIKNMCKRFKDRYKRELKYVATLEWQEKRHCLHVHMIIDCDYIENSVWQYKLWAQGYTSIRSISHGKSRSECLNAVSYVLKYIGKDAESCGYYHHLYMRSKNWNTDVKKDYRVTRNSAECYTIAKYYFLTSKLHIERFECLLYDGLEIEVVDVYVLK